MCDCDMQGPCMSHTYRPMFFRPQDTQLVISLCRLFWSVVNEEAQGDHDSHHYWMALGLSLKDQRKSVQSSMGVVC